MICVVLAIVLTVLEAAFDISAVVPSFSVLVELICAEVLGISGLAELLPTDDVDAVAIAEQL